MTGETHEVHPPQSPVTPPMPPVADPAPATLRRPHCLLLPPATHQPTPCRKGHNSWPPNNRADPQVEETHEVHLPPPLAALATNPHTKQHQCRHVTNQQHHCPTCDMPGPTSQTTGPPATTTSQSHHPPPLVTADTPPLDASWPPTAHATSHNMVFEAMVSTQPHHATSRAPHDHSRCLVQGRGSAGWAQHNNCPNPPPTREVPPQQCLSLLFAQLLRVFSPHCAFEFAPVNLCIS